MQIVLGILGVVVAWGVGALATGIGELCNAADLHPEASLAALDGGPDLPASTVCSTADPRKCWNLSPVCPALDTQGQVVSTICTFRSCKHPAARRFRAAERSGHSFSSAISSTEAPKAGRMTTSHKMACWTGVRFPLHLPRITPALHEAGIHRSI